MTNSKIEFESFIKAHWSQEDKANAEAALTFVQQIMNDHNFDAIRDRFKGKNYKQHNRNIADGIEGVIKTISDLVKNAPEFSYDVKYVFVDGFDGPSKSRRKSTAACFNRTGNGISLANGLAT